MKRLLIGLALSLLTAAAHSQWVFVTENENEAKVYADPSTKRRTGSVVRLWELASYGRPNVIEGTAYYSDRAYVQYDCAERTRQILQITGFAGKMASGDQVGSDNQPRRKSFIEPGSVGVSMINYACK